MPEDLQALIDRLQRDAVNEGQRRADAIVEAARAEAAALVRDAEAEAGRRLAQAERDAAVFTERSTVALEQAGRDLLLTVRAAIGDLLGGLIRASLADELRPDLLAQMLVTMADGYTAHGGRERRMAVLVSPDDLDAMVALYAQRYREKLVHGVELTVDPDIEKGFRVVLVDEHVEHDLTVEAIAEVLSGYLTPRLADLLPRVAVELERAATAGADAGADPDA
jgi:V/A-type H+-transporting ATPase subunit E